MLAVLAYGLPMPVAPAAASPFGGESVICTAHGPMTLAQYGGQEDGAPRTTADAHCLLCLGGGLAKLPPPNGPLLRQPPLTLVAGQPVVPAPHRSTPGAHRPQSPRAPPLPA